MNAMPPGKVMLLLQIHCFAAMRDVKLDGSPATVSWTTQLLHDALIEVDTDRIRNVPVDVVINPFRTTARGKFFVEKICGVDLPVLEEKWV